mgnify:FL=1|tara:strand:- start:168 stop:890 length:723 start_codon:yes stop_codon:yes gene_type:complete
MSNTIQSLWIGDKISNVEKLCINSYIKNGHDFHLYTYGVVEGVPDNCEVKDAKEILPQEDIFSYNVGIGKGSYSAFSNYFRYKLLDLRGGWWTDTDIVCLKKIEIKDDFAFASEKTADGKSHITSGLIKAPAGSEFCKYCYDFCEQQNKETLAWGTVGPRLVSKAANALSLSDYVRPWRFFNPIGFEQVGMLFDETFGDMDLSDSYTIHLWNEMWRRHNLDKDKTYDPNCLFEKLKKKYL